MSQKFKICSTSLTFRWQGLSVKGNGNFAERLIATQSPGTRSRSRPTALENFQTVEMQDSRLILLQALAAAESGRSTWPAACSRPVHCVHLLHLPAPTVHLPAVCCKPLQPPCNSPAVSALPPDVVTDAPVAAFGCGEPCGGAARQPAGSSQRTPPQTASAPPSPLPPPIPCYRNKSCSDILKGKGSNTGSQKKRSHPLTFCLWYLKKKPDRHICILQDQGSAQGIFAFISESSKLSSLFLPNIW